MSDFFKTINSKISMKRANNIINPLLYSNSEDPIITFLVDDYLNKYAIEAFLDLIHKEMYINFPIQIVFAFPFIPTKKDLSTNLIKFYRHNHINLKKYIPEHSRIITTGRAIYAITESEDLNINTFYDFIFNKSYFYTPELKSYVFPVNYINSLYFENSFKEFFMFKQLKLAQELELPIVRDTILICSKINDIDKFINKYEKNKIVAFDTETTGLDYFYDNVGCITFSFDGINGYYLDFKKEYVSKLSKFFENKFQIGANLKFDIRFLHKYGVKNLKIDFDTFQAGHKLNEMRSNSLNAHAWLYTRFGGYDKDLENYKDKYKIKNYMKIPESIRLPYASKDAIITYQVYEAMQKQMDKIDKDFPVENEWSLNKYYYDIVIPSVNMYIDIEEVGIPINWETVKDISKSLELKIIKIKKKIYESFNIKESELNIDSGQELGTFLEKRGWSVVERAKLLKKNNLKEFYYKTNDNILKKWERQGYKQASLLLKYRELSTLQKTFIGYEKINSGIWQYRKSDNKIYPEYMVMATKTHRNKAKNPNSQNWPKHGENAKLIRSIFTVPSKDYVIGEVDTAGFQLRIGAILSGDKNMRKIFTELHGDMHSITAQQILKSDISIEEFLRRKGEPEISEIRFKAKPINFSLEFGSSAYNFAKESLQNEWSLMECKNYIKKNNLQSLYNMMETKVLNDNLKQNEKTEWYKRNNFIEDIKKYNRDFIYYWTVAIDIKKKYFKTYPGLKDLIDKSISFAIKNGYVRSSFGAIRRLPELLYSGNDNQINIKNLKNISVNSPVQNFEISVMHLGMIALHKYMKKIQLKSKLFGMVHDSILLYIHRDEIKLLQKVIPSFFEKDIPEYKGIPIKVEGELSDVMNTNETWGFGSYWF